MHHVNYLLSRGFSSAIARATFGFIAGASVAGRLGIGFLLDRFETRYLAAIGLTIQVMAAIIIMNATTLPLVYLYVVLFGIASGAGIVAQVNFFGAYYGREHFARIMGEDNSI